MERSALVAGAPASWATILPDIFESWDGRVYGLARRPEVFAAAKRDGFSWSIHRPHTIIGYALGNAMSMGTTLAAYATIQRETGRPFLFPGSAVQWNALPI